MTAQQAVQVYLKQLQESGYSYSERAHKARILNRWFIIALALHHPTVPSKLHALPFSILLEASSEKAKHFLESFQKEGASVKYLNLKVFLEAHPELFDSAKSVLRLLAGRLALKDISERVGKQMLEYLKTLSVDRAASYSRAFFIFCREGFRSRFSRSRHLVGSSTEIPEISGRRAQLERRRYRLLCPKAEGFH